MTTSSYAERFQDIAILQLNTEGFAALTLRQKRLAYHLAQAGLWGRAISMDQGSVHNLPLIAALMALYEASQREPSASVSTKQALRNTLFVLFAHNGLYHSMSGDRLELPLTAHAVDEAAAWNPGAAKTVRNIVFQEHVLPHRTVQTDGVDAVAQSGAISTRVLPRRKSLNFGAPRTLRRSIPRRCLRMGSTNDW